MAAELGLPLGDYLRATTERQHRVWLAWLDLQLERPSRADGYLMALTHEVRYLMAKRRPPFRSQDYLLRSAGTVEGPAPALPGTQEHVAEAAKAHAAAVAKVRSVSRVTAAGTIHATATAEQIRAMTPAERLARGNRQAKGK